MRWNRKLDRELLNVIVKKISNSVKDPSMQMPIDTPLYASFKNDILKEYLIPEI